MTRLPGRPLTAREQAFQNLIRGEQGGQISRQDGAIGYSRRDPDGGSTLILQGDQPHHGENHRRQQESLRRIMEDRRQRSDFTRLARQQAHIQQQDNLDPVQKAGRLAGLEYDARQLGLGIKADQYRDRVEVQNRAYEGRLEQRARMKLELDSQIDQRNARAASRDMREIMRLKQGGHYTPAQITKVAAAFAEEYGPQVALTTPGYADLMGVGGQLREAREESLLKFAEERGIGRRFVAWDDRAQAPTFNADEFALESKKAEIEADRLKPKNEALKSLASMYKPEKPRRRDYVHSLSGAFDSGAYEADLRAFQEEAAKHVQSFSGGALSDEELERFVPTAPEGGGLAQQLAEGVAAPAAQTFTTQADAVMAAQTGRLKPGSEFFIGGTAYTLGMDGAARLRGR